MDAFRDTCRGKRVSPGFCPIKLEQPYQCKFSLSGKYDHHQHRLCLPFLFATHRRLQQDEHDLLAISIAIFHVRCYEKSSV